MHHSFAGHFALRAGRGKLIASRTAEPAPGEPAGQLDDLVADPAETTNLWAERPEVVVELSARLDAMREASRSVPERR